MATYKKIKIGSPIEKGKVLSVSQSYKPSHQALDFGYPTAKYPAKLCAVEDGTVGRKAPSDAPWISKQGFTLTGESGAIYLYQHAQPTKTGKVKRGAVIGYVDTPANQRKCGNKMKDGYDHLHFEVHPTGKWEVRDQPLCYFNRKEVKYTRQPACTSTPINYSGVTNKYMKIKISEDDMYKKKYKDCIKSRDKYKANARKYKAQRKEYKSQLDKCKKEKEKLDKDFISRVQSEVDKRTKALKIELEGCKKALKECKGTQDTSEEKKRTFIERILNFIFPRDE